MTKTEGFQMLISYKKDYLDTYIHPEVLKLKDLTEAVRVYGTGDIVKRILFVKVKVENENRIHM